MLMLGNLSGQCKRGCRRLSPADDGTAEAFECCAQGGVCNALETALERLTFRRQQRARRHRRRLLRQGRRPLDEDQPGHRAIAEIAVDALEQNRLAVLDLERQRRGDPQPQRAVAPLAPDEGELDRPALARQRLADDGRPFLEQLRPAEPLLAEHRLGDPRQAGADRPHDATPLLAALACQRRLRWPPPGRRKGCSPGTTGIAACCRGALCLVPNPIPTASGSAKSCCSRRPSWPSRPISPLSWRAGRMSPRLPPPISTRFSMPGKASATTPGRATCTPVLGKSSPGTMANFRATKRRCARCPASAATPRRRLPPSPSGAR